MPLLIGIVRAIRIGCLSVCRRRCVYRFSACIVLLFLHLSLPCSTWGQSPMSKPKVERVSKKQARALLADPSTKFDADLSEQSRSKVYELKDGRMLISTSYGTSVIWPSRAELEKLRKDFEDNPQVHYLTGRMILGEAFAKSVPTLLEALRNRVELSKEEFGFNDVTLKKIDRVYLKQIGRSNCLAPEHFEPLLAYVGEYLRTHLGGEWQMRLGFKQTWEPWLVFADGVEYQPYMLLLRELQKGRTPSIHLALLFEVVEFRQQRGGDKAQ